MLISIEPIVGRHIRMTCLNLAQESHWFHRYQCPGRWHGAGADQIHLKRPVRLAALMAVLDGWTPDRKVRLAEDAGDSAVGFLENGHAKRIPKDSLHVLREAKLSAYCDTYQSELENRLRLQITREGGLFEVAGVPSEAAREMTKTFGNNLGREFERFAERRNAWTTYYCELRERWNNFASKEGWDKQQAKDLLSHARSHCTEAPGKKQTQRHGH